MGIIEEAERICYIPPKEAAIMAEWKELGNKAKNLTLAGLGKARDLGRVPS